MKKRIKSAMFFCLYYSGLEFLLARLIPVRGVILLMYHGVCEQSAIPEHINFHVHPSIFERQLRALKKRYRVIPLKDVVTALKENQPLEKAVVLTFDDGYRNNAQYAAPILKRLDLPFTVFVATEYVDSGAWIPLNEIYWMWSEGKLSTDQMNKLRGQIRGRSAAEARAIIRALPERPRTASRIAEDSFGMLSWQEICEMARTGADFGSHTHTHCNMAAENDEAQRAELGVSRQRLAENLGAPTTLFAYPFGHLEHMSEQSRRNVINAGYECALSTEVGVVTSHSDRFCLPRMGCDDRIWMFAGEVLLQFAKQVLKRDWSDRTSSRDTIKSVEVNGIAELRSRDN